MGIVSIVTDQAGQVGYNPRIVKVITTDNLSTVTTAGYLNPVTLQGYNILPTDEIHMWYGYVSSSNPGTFSVFLATISDGIITLAQDASEGNVLLPVLANHFATFNGTSGQIKSDAATAINSGNIQAGLSGTAGYLASFSSTAARGSLRVAAVANTGDTVTTLSNAAMGQASTITIPDPANAAGSLLIGAGATPFVSGNFPVASGTGGLMVDSGLAASNIVAKDAANTMAAGSSIVLAKVNGVEAANAVTASGVAGTITTSSLTTAGGASYAITWTNTFISATSSVLLTIAGGTNTTQNITLTVVPGPGTATLTIYNNTAATALDGTIIISYAVF